MSVVSEGWYYKWRAIKSPGRMRWGWIISANVFSSFVLVLLPYVALALSTPGLAWQLAPYQVALGVGSVTASVILFIGSFFAPDLLRQMRASPLAQRKVESTADIPASP